MNFIANMRISHKISALMIGLILGFIIIGITYYIQINLEKKARSHERGATAIQTEMMELALLNAELNAATELYLLSGDQPQLVKARELQASVDAKLSSLEENSSVAPKIAADLALLKENFNEYSTVFNQAVGGINVLGQDASLGLRGQLANISLDVETMLAGNIYRDILSQFYLLRFREGQLFLENNPGAIQAFNTQIGIYLEAVESGQLTPTLERRLDSLIESYQQVVEQLSSQQQKMGAVTETLNDVAGKTQASITAMLTDAQAIADELQTVGSQQKLVTDAIVTAIIFVVAIGTAVGIYLIYKSIVFPMVHIQSVIRKINRGKTQARVKVLSQDELGDLGSAFNKLLDERIQQLEDQSKDNDKLNNSIISLIRALGLIAQKNLTVKVPVSADITGTISDAVNLLTTETAKTLQQVRTISDEVNTVSTQLEEQSDVVIKFAENERRQIIATSKALEILANAMNDIAKRSDAANKEAERAISSTQAARATVVETVTGIRTIRETISETEKRVKRLGERSQEVSGIVNLINTIAERTHILALNASMHAASAGEAGKGFAVVADEVQRLAESARQSTDEIAAMVNSMRVDTSDTVTIMNTLISQVVDGTRLAEEAGHRMEDTEQATKDLVANVKVIAQHATQQAEIATRVKDRAAIIRTFTEKTGRQLEEQRKQTQGLRLCATTLVERVNVFVLPDAAEETPSSGWSNVSKLPTAAEAS